MRTCMIVLDEESNVRFMCPEAMAKAMAKQPGMIVTQDDEHYYVVAATELADIVLDLHL
jgi:hypothetical protein